MKRAAIIIVALSGAIVPGCASAAEPPPVLASQLAGNTLSAVAFVAREAGVPGNGNGPMGGELARIMLQAYLGADGRALVRAWDASRDAYTAPAERRWSLTGSTFCVDVPLAGPRPICADIHIWGPRIGGVGVKPYAMLDGDLRPGNAIGSAR